MKSFTKFLFPLSFFLLTLKAWTQVSDNYVYWSSARKLTVNDFAIRSDHRTMPCFAQFYLSYEVSGFDFMTKNFNKKVHNCIIRSASWIDTTYDIRSSLQYQQTLFDLAEIYARHFRKDLRENRKKIMKGSDFVKELNAKAMTDFSNRRIEYDAETKSGTDKLKQEKWEEQIKLELSQLKEYGLEEN